MSGAITFITATGEPGCNETLTGGKVVVVVGDGVVVGVGRSSYTLM